LLGGPGFGAVHGKIGVTGALSTVVLRISSSRAQAGRPGLEVAAFGDAEVRVGWDDGPAVGQQLPAIVEQHDTVAEQEHGGRARAALAGAGGGPTARPPSRTGLERAVGHDLAVSGLHPKLHLLTIDPSCRPE
jgi:hypothetical protein